MTTAQSLAGTWAANVRGWLWTALPVSLIGVTQELGTQFPDPWWVVLSVLFQWVLSSAWSAAVATVSRRRYGTVVPVASALLWIGFGVARGIAGGLVATAAGVDPEWLYRIAFWTTVAVLWMPLLTYALAQWDEHRRLLAVRAELADALATAERLAAEGADVRIRRVSDAVENALSPTLDEIRATLRDNAARIDDGSARAIVERLDELAARTASFRATTPPVTSPRPDVRMSVVSAAHEFELDRPVFAALLTAIATSPLVLPDAFRAGGWQHLAEAAVALIAATVLLIGAFAVLRAIRIPLRRRSLLSRLGVVAAGVAGSVILVFSPLHPFDEVDLPLVLVFPLVFAVTASVIATAVAYGTTNIALERSVRRDEDALAAVAERVRDADETVAGRLERLVRGDLNGLLAACAMALGFLATNSVTPARRDEVVEVVLERLDAAATELRSW